MMLSCFVALSVSLTLKALPLQDKGNIVKQNRFVRNMASVLRINPERIRVTNIVPGNRRRLQEPASCTAAGAVEQSVCDAALVSDPGGTDCTNAGCTYVAPSLSAGGLDIGFECNQRDQ